VPRRSSGELRPAPISRIGSRRGANFLPRRHASPRSVDKVSARANQGVDHHRVFVSLYALRSASRMNELRALGLAIAHRSTDSAAGHDSPWSDPNASSFPVRIPSLSSPGPLLHFAHCGLGPRACPHSFVVLWRALRWGKHGAAGCRDRDWGNSPRRGSSRGQSRLDAR
jgi:hypothetical protein